MLDACQIQNIDSLQMTKMHELIKYLKVEDIDRETCMDIFNSKQECSDLYRLAASHGVLALVYDVVKNLFKECQLPLNIKMQWALSVENIERRYRKQEILAQELAQIYNNNGIRTIVLKGLAISNYYPIPEHRECGDLDCLLVKASPQQGDIAAINEDGRPITCYDKGNELAKEMGAKVEIGFYKHSHIHYKGLAVENHAFCTAVRGSRDRKALERHLQQLLVEKPLTRIGNTNLYCPCADFNALFLTAHSFGHFLTEGIKLRHILDWAYLLKAEQNSINWKSFYEWCDRMHYTKFADALTAISIKYFGLTITNIDIHQHSDIADKVLNDIIHCNSSIAKTHSSKFRKRLNIIRKRMFGGWKYSELYERSAFIDTMQMVLAFFTERKPKI